MKNLFFTFVVGCVFSVWPAFAEKLKVVERAKVCMVNDLFFDRPQIPVQYSGKTYYGCCQNCKKTLAEDYMARNGTDALTGKPVDKATAVIAAREDGSVLYFANKANFEQYLKKTTANQ